MLDDARFPPVARTYCVPCNVAWVPTPGAATLGHDACWCCGKPGVLAEFAVPAGWPKTTVTVDHLPRAVTL